MEKENDSKSLSQLVNSLHRSIVDTDDDTKYYLRAGVWPDEEEGHVWLVGYFSDEINAWWCVGRGQTMYRAVNHLKKQLQHREPNERRV